MQPRSGYLPSAAFLPWQAFARPPDVIVTGGAMLADSVVVLAVVVAFVALLAFFRRSNHIFVKVSAFVAAMCRRV
jgi:hypothetical protein